MPDERTSGAVKAAIIDHKAKERFSKIGSGIVLYCAFIAACYYAGKEAYGIRLYAINTFGRVIHEVRTTPRA